ncbi:hypothetical protein CPB86DRAFT_787703 [Serendipita vermifera]|nr:hypothetical protein CPB86DRAFT_787703 [Serendipita vermifera]
MDNLLNALPYPHPRPCPTLAESLQARNRINEIDEDIKGLQIQVRKLQTRIISLRRQRDNHVSYIAPFRCLPTEILIEIIQICLENDVKRNTLMRICGTVRDIVVGAPTFWNTIALCGPHRKLVPLQYIRCSTVEQLDRALQRANPSALDINIYVNDNPKLLRFLCSQDHRIHSLTLNGDLNPRNEDTSDLPFKNFHLLHLNRLKYLSLHRLSNSLIKKFMDLASQSSQEVMNLTLQPTNREIPAVLEHNLLHRAERLSIEPG